MNITFLKSLQLRLLTLLVSSLCFSAASAQNLNTHTDTDSVSVGDIFNYSISLKLDQEYQAIQFPDTALFPTSLELVNRQRFRVSEFADSISYQFQYFDNDDVQIPPLEVTLISESDSVILKTQPVTLFFKNVVAEGDTTLKPMRPNFKFPKPWWPWILAAIALAAFLIWWFKFRSQPESEPEKTAVTIEPFYNPLEALEKRLAEVKEHSNIAVTKDFKGFYSEVGDAIRAYFEELYNIPALESTSTELLRYLDAYGVDENLIEKTRTVLRKADLVKFAKFTPTLDDARNTLDEAFAFANRAKLADSARISRLRAQYNARIEQLHEEDEGRKQEES
ncbi:hypothetical protein [Gracilimonas tropica]|uniref:hypothetical protein n=1 Tax=Gracilimonas tropica TaxID=454600 RepID=UPI000382EEA1|nr:hypothetical protein [Gracilimonas tropica]